MKLMEKLSILSDAAKYDVACTSSGADRGGQKGKLGNTALGGICHSFSADGRCISLLKVLLTNRCIYHCKYCVNRCGNDVPRAAFSPRELAKLTIEFYRRNYIEGLFLSSGVWKSPDDTCEQLLACLRLLRTEYHFRGYIHVKAIPGSDPSLLYQLGLLADRMSVNIELPSQRSLSLLAPDKSKHSILQPMGMISHQIEQNSRELSHYRYAPSFVPAGQSTQMIIGATPDTDFQILKLSESLYQKYRLKRVFYSAYMPVSNDALLPPVEQKPPLLREHRLYQADWLLRFYGFHADELLDDRNPDFNLLVDPKCSWALSHMDWFPVEVNRAPYETLLRVPGIGVKSAHRILTARKSRALDFAELRKIGVVLKRAQYFITCSGKKMDGLRITPEAIARNLISDQNQKNLPAEQGEQLSLFEKPAVFAKDVITCLKEV